MDVDDEPPVLLDRASRATRGKRITKLIEDEDEHDEAFWNQDALKDEENDDNYEEEQDAGDEFDSDFGQDESEPDDDPEKEVQERLPIKKRLVFPGKTLRKTNVKKKKKVTPKLEDDEKSTDKPSPSRQADAPDEFETEKIIRKSTRTSVIVRQAEREAIRAEKEATAKPIIKKKKEGEEKRMTQEEMLLEAAETEIMNLRNLERVLAREEEVKKKAVVHKDTYDGPVVRFCSRDGESRLEFINGASFGSELCTTSAPYPEKSICVVTGLPAKYRDPKTGLPYATMEAFKIIRESFLKEAADKRRPNMLKMGELFESITGEYSMPKKRRIDVRSPNVSAGRRHGGRFRQIPALDSTDED
ncbi:hypothetical protein EJB05_10360 [Eragrostis curvula]|uniref:Vps72/YL1 C-terminal domain-containing protein n=1 Tax=Eragrostis curvula TaxID=38414 RepID=A0A5J9W8Y9_9POAL|nr:hypothetical protein EJB05_10360 [Eragrostis curvula]